MVHLTVLAVPGCPNVALLEERLACVLGSRRDVTVSRHVIADEREAARRGMHGSPTILVDGADPFAGPGQAASVSCRCTGTATGGLAAPRRWASCARPSGSQPVLRRLHPARTGWMRSVVAGEGG